MTKAATGTTGKNPQKTTYHHGNLTLALTQAARDILEEEGLSRLSLRAAARRVGVSQAAPYHHFKDKEALLAGVATQGHIEFNRAMQEQMAGAGTDPKARLIACGVAYVTFATDNPALFQLMFGSTIEHCENYDALIQAGRESYQTLEIAEAALLEEMGGDKSTLPLRALGSWSIVHGLATLLIDGGLDIKNFPCESIRDLAERLLEARFI